MTSTYGYKYKAEQAEYWVHEVYCTRTSANALVSCLFLFHTPCHISYLDSRVRIFLLPLEQKRTTKSRAAPFRAAPRLASEHPTCPCLSKRLPFLRQRKISGILTTSQPTRGSTCLSHIFLPSMYDVYTAPWTYIQICTIHTFRGIGGRSSTLQR